MTTDRPREDDEERKRVRGTFASARDMSRPGFASAMDVFGFYRDDIPGERERERMQHGRQLAQERHERMCGRGVFVPHRWLWLPPFPHLCTVAVSLSLSLSGIARWISTTTARFDPVHSWPLDRRFFLMPARNLRSLTGQPLEITAEEPDRAARAGVNTLQDPTARATYGDQSGNMFGTTTETAFRLPVMFTTPSMRLRVLGLSSEQGMRVTNGHWSPHAPPSETNALVDAILPSETEVQKLDRERSAAAAESMKVGHNQAVQNGTTALRKETVSSDVSLLDIRARAVHSLVSFHHDVLECPPDVLLRLEFPSEVPTTLLQDLLSLGYLGDARTVLARRAQRAFPR